VSANEALAQALHEVKAVGGPWMPCQARGTCECRPMAKHLLAALPPGAAIVTEESLAEALEDKGPTDPWPYQVYGGGYRKMAAAIIEAVRRG